MRRVLIAGCGYLGQSAADLFYKAGWLVEAWTKSAESAKKLSPEKYQIHAVDLTNADDMAAHEANFDVVIHCASTRGGTVDLYRKVYLNGARNLLRQFSKSRILLVGSTSVYAQTNGEWVTEQSQSEPEHERGKILREVETLLLESGGIVARLAGIYGPGRSYLLQRFLAGEALIASKNDRFVNQVHRDDAAAALFILANRGPAAAGQIFNVADDQPTLQGDCYRWLANKLGRALPPEGESASPRKRGRSNKRVSNSKLRALGWTPRYRSFTEAMEESILPSFLSDSSV